MKRLESESRLPGMKASVHYERPELSDKARIAGEIRRQEREQDEEADRKIKNLGKLINKIQGTIK